jgi:flagellin-like hook-associated protein FlgL
MQSQSGLNSPMENLSTGSRINCAQDNAAGQAITTHLTAEVQGLAAALRSAYTSFKNERTVCSVKKWYYFLSE